MVQQTNKQIQKQIRKELEQPYKEAWIKIRFDDQNIQSHCLVDLPDFIKFKILTTNQFDFLNLIYTERDKHHLRFNLKVTEFELLMLNQSELVLNQSESLIKQLKKLEKIHLFNILNENSEDSEESEPDNSCVECPKCKKFNCTIQSLCFSPEKVEQAIKDKQTDNLNLYSLILQTHPLEQIKLVFINYKCKNKDCPEIIHSKKEKKEHKQYCQFSPVKVAQKLALDTYNFCNNLINSKKDLQTIHQELQTKYGEHCTTNVINSLLKPMIYQITSTKKRVQVNKVQSWVYVYSMTEIPNIDE